jgi:CBS domain-containing protein
MGREGARHTSGSSYCRARCLTENLITVAEDTPVRDVAARMANRGVHRLIVVDTDQQIRGIVTSLDVLWWVAAQP